MFDRSSLAALACLLPVPASQGSRSVSEPARDGRELQETGPRTAYAFHRLSSATRTASSNRTLTPIAQITLGDRRRSHYPPYRIIDWRRWLP